MILLQANNISKSYPEAEGKLDVLKDVSLVVHRGKTLAITGESGSGKSTLLHILGLLDNPDTGNLLWEGKPLNLDDKAAGAFRCHRMGFVFQFHYLLQDFDAIDNIALPMQLAGSNLREARQRAFELLCLLELQNRRHHYPNQLSGGEQQRVAIARALMNKPDIVFMDEPTGNLDPRHSDRIVEFILKLNREFGQTFVLVTHNREIAALMDDHLVLHKGAVKPAQ